WDWDGGGLVVAVRVPERRREVRRQPRTRLAWGGFASLGGGLWISPLVEREAELHASAANGSVAELQSFDAELGSIGEPGRLVAEAWDLDAVAAAHRAFAARFARLRPKAPEAVFRAQTQPLHDWR